MGYFELVKKVTEFTRFTPEITQGIIFPFSTCAGRLTTSGMISTLGPCFITNRNEDRIISLMTGNEKIAGVGYVIPPIYQYFHITC